MRHAVLAVLTVAVGAALLIGSAAAASASNAVHYVALGDSYAAGVGAGGESGSCDRSPNAYSALWATAHSPASYTSVACTGATTATVESSQLSALSASTTLVSITVGGNDEQFSSVMQDCVLDGTSTCVSEVTAAAADARATLPEKLATLFGEIAARAPQARLVVLGYPHFYDLSNNCIGLSQSSRTAIDSGIDTLDGLLSGAATAAGATFADVRGTFTGHEICDGNRWLHSVNIFDIDESYHPTSDGQRHGYLPALTAAT